MPSSHVIGPESVSVSSSVSVPESVSVSTEVVGSIVLAVVGAVLVEDSSLSLALVVVPADVSLELSLVPLVEPSSPPPPLSRQPPHNAAAASSAHVDRPQAI
jgi:hypothetical protein